MKIVTSILELKKKVNDKILWYYAGYTIKKWRLLEWWEKKDKEYNLLRKGDRKDG